MANESTNLIYAGVIFGIMLVLVGVQIYLFVRSNKKVDAEVRKKRKEQSL
jgi:hypothetical protein